MPNPSTIINPFAEKNEKDQTKAKKMDIINLARSIVHFHPTTPIEKAFDIAERFRAEQERRYPMDITKPVGEEHE